MPDKKKMDQSKLELIKGAMQKMVAGGHCAGGGEYCAPEDDSCTKCWNCDGEGPGRCYGCGGPNCAYSF